MNYSTTEEGSEPMNDNHETEIHECLGGVSAWLERLTKEQRYRFFKETFLSDFTHEEDGTTYIVRTHYSPGAEETLQERAARLVTKS